MEKNAKNIKKKEKEVKQKVVIKSFTHILVHIYKHKMTFVSPLVFRYRNFHADLFFHFESRAAAMCKNNIIYGRKNKAQYSTDMN